MSLLERLEVERIQQTIQAVTVPDGESGTLRWVEPIGKTIDRFQALATVTSEIDEIDITAPEGGKLTQYVVPDGAHVNSGDVVAWFAFPKRTENTPKPRKQVNPIPTPPEPQEAPQHTNGTAKQAVEEQTPEPEEEAPKPARPKTKTKPRKKRTKNRTYSIAEHQEKDIAKLAAKLKLREDAPVVNESELVRTAIRMLLSTPEPALLSWIRENKEYEAREKFGTGRPRPGRPARVGA